jgi:hypothetical protein
MNVIQKSKFLNMGVKKQQELLPCKLTVDDEVVMVCAKPEDIIVVGDLNIFVRQQLKAREELARQGMPKDTPVVAEEVKEEVVA